MPARTRTLLSLAPAALLAGGAAWAQGSLDPALAVSGNPAMARQALARAVKDGRQARYRAERLEEDARRATQRAERTASQAAAVAARVQETEARISARQAQLRLMGEKRGRLDARLARRQEPVIRLFAALQRLSRRPPVLGLLRPGSVRDAVRLRALLDTMLPLVAARTAGLRLELARVRALADQQAAAALALDREKERLRQRQRRLAALESQERLNSRRVAGIASRENERALALAERTRDLEELAAVMGRQGRLRAELAALPGPVPRPARPEDSRVVESRAPLARSPGLQSYILPVAGRLVTGFAETTRAGRASGAIVLAARGGAQVVAPSDGRVAFAGPYRGFGRIVIIEHQGGWTSLVTGLARLDVAVGETLLAGSPLGVVEPSDGRVRLELRKDGEPVNPLRYMRDL